MAPASQLIGRWLDVGKGEAAGAGDAGELAVPAMAITGLVLGGAYWMDGCMHAAREP